LAAWADDEFRSINGQIEFLLTECVKRRKRGANAKDEQPAKLAQSTAQTEQAAVHTEPDATNAASTSDIVDVAIMQTTPDAAVVSDDAHAPYAD